MQLGERVGEVAVDESSREIGQALPLDDCDNFTIDGDAVVADGQSPSLGTGLLAGEAVGIVLPGVDEDSELLVPRRSWVGIRIPGRAFAVVRGDCQKISSRPSPWVVKTNCERFSLGRSSTRSTATPRRRQLRTGASSTTSGRSGQASARWQYTFAVRGQVSAAFSTSAPLRSGSRSRYTVVTGVGVPRDGECRCHVRLIIRTRHGYTSFRGCEARPCAHTRRPLAEYGSFELRVFCVLW